MIDAVVAGALGALIADALGTQLAVMITAAVGAFLVTGVLTAVYGIRTFLQFKRALEARFPTETSLDNR